jgi:serine/threonine-protein kinase
MGRMLAESTVAGSTGTDWVRTLGRAFEVFDLQDSGNVSYGVETATGERRFVKCATTPSAAQGLERAVRLHKDVTHPAIVAPQACVRFRDGLCALVFPWLEGTVLNPTTKLGWEIRRHPDGPLVRFRSLPTATVYPAIDAILDAHQAVSAAGYVAVDLYDGCFLYNFWTNEMRLVDLDEYRPGPFRVDGDRLPGSRRFMAPEEFQRGAVIDARTTVFNLGRTIRLLLDATDVEEQWRGTPEQLEVIEHACASDPAGRFLSVADLVQAWRAAV